jgi:hypothetical protein
VVPARRQGAFGLSYVTINGGTSCAHILLSELLRI